MFSKGSSLLQEGYFVFVSGDVCHFFSSSSVDSELMLAATLEKSAKF